MDEEAEPIVQTFKSQINETEFDKFVDDLEHDIMIKVDV